MIRLDGTTTISEAFTDVLANYPLARKQPLKDHPLANFLRKEVPRIIKNKANLGKPYIIEGSPGQGNWAEVPWVCVFDSGVSTSAQHGYYCVYLFGAEGKSVYLSLGLGWTQFAKNFRPKKNARKSIVSAVKNCRAALTGKLANLNTLPINLDAKDELAKGYELGHVCSKCYRKDQMPSDDVLVADLKEMLDVYASLKGFIGKQNIVTLLAEIQKKSILEDNAKDASYQQEITFAKGLLLNAGPLPRGLPSRDSESVRWPRDPQIAKHVCEDKSYKCEVGDHPTFIAQASSKPYVEAHHLIPIGYQDAFEYSLDVPENILILCPLCHRQFHHAQPARRDMILEKFYYERKDGLLSRGLALSLEKLKEYY